MNPLGGLWTALKALLSLAFLALAALGVVLLVQEPGVQHALLVVVALGLAALPWVMHLPERTRQILVAWACMATGASFLYIAWLNASGAVAYPRDCSQSSLKGHLSCDLFNALASQWGAISVAGIFLAIGVLAIVGGFVFNRYARRAAAFQEKGVYR